MTSVLLYACVVLIWGSSWILLKLQVGFVSPEASVVYRFMIAAALMFAWVRINRIPVRFDISHHIFFALQGAFIFCTNYVLFYHAANYLTSGLLAVVFSTASAMVVLINALLYRKKPQWVVFIGSLTGVAGIGAIFWPEISGLTGQQNASLGLILSVLGTLCFSIGSLISHRNQNQGISVRGSTAWAMFYGALLLNVYILLSGIEYRFDPSFPYVSALICLAIFGSVIAFVAYFSLLGRIGTEKAAYATVLFPIVALGISTIFEGYQWTTMAIIGLGLTLIGNILVLRGREAG